MTSRFQNFKMDPSELVCLQLLSETKQVEEDDSDLIAVITAIVSFFSDSNVYPSDCQEILSQYSLDDFRSAFGLQRGTFDLLHSLYERTRPMSQNCTSSIGLAKQLLVTLWYSTNQESFQEVACRYDICEAKALTCIRRTTSWINSVVKKIFLRWPRGKRATEVLSTFKKLTNISGILGAIGCFYIRIKSQPEDHSYFKVENGNRTIVMQVVTLPNLMFSDVFCGKPDTGGDEKYVFENSPLNEILRTNPQSLFPDNCRLIASEAYPKIPWLAAPYVDRGYLTRDQKAFNKRHEKITSLMTKSLEILYKRFPRLQLMDLKNTDHVEDVAISCCVLHNICCLTEDEVEKLINQNK